MKTDYLLCVYRVNRPLFDIKYDTAAAFIRFRFLLPSLWVLLFMKFEMISVFILILCIDINFCE